MPHTVSGNEMVALILAGGLGTRLRPVVSDKPKALAPVGSEPFLRLLIGQLRSQGIRHLVLCTGYLGDQLEAEFGDGRDEEITVAYSREPQAMGTAGAIQFARHHLEGLPEFLVMNGDSLAEIEFEKLLTFHRQHGGIATIAVRTVENAARYGTVEVNGEGRVKKFAEKGMHGPGTVNAGIYVFSQDLFQHIHTFPASLERDVFPKLLEYGIFAYEQAGIFIDIGTPEDYLLAMATRSQLETAALKTFS